MTSNGVSLAASTLTIALPPTQCRFSGSGVLRKMQVCVVSTISTLTSGVPGRLAALRHSRHARDSSHRPLRARPSPNLRETGCYESLVGVRCMHRMCNLRVFCPTLLKSSLLGSPRCAAKQQLANLDSRAYASPVTPMNACGLTEPTLGRPDFGSTV
jgi:hypothetical protein